jgi:hypothetical protein
MNYMAELPTKEYLKQLPLKAIVAYAVRNARRVQPLYQRASVIEDHQKHSQSIDKALTVAERWAKGDEISSDERVDAKNDTVTAYGTYFYYCNRTPTEIERNLEMTRQTNERASGYYAANTAINTLLIVARENSDYAICNANNAAIYAAVAANAVKSDDNANYVKSTYDLFTAQAIQADYDKLLSLKLTEDDTIDASEDGPLGPYWPDGEPDWYQKYYPEMRSLLDEQVT